MALNNNQFNFSDQAARNDVFADQQALDRRRQILDALQKQSMGTPLVGGQGGLQAILHVLTGALVNKGRSKLETDADANRAQYQSQLRGELGNYMDTYQGKPAMFSQQEAVDRNDNPLPSMDQAPVQANPREAVLRAMTSQFPEMQTIGKAGFTELAKRDMPRYEKVGDSYYQINPDGTSRLVVNNEKPVVVNSQLVKPNSKGTGQPEVVGDFRNRYNGVGPVGTDSEGHQIMGQANKDTGEVKFAPRGVVVNTAEKAADAFAKAMGPAKAKAIETSFGQAQSAQQALAALSEARKDYEAGIKSGASGAIDLTLSKVGKALKISGSDDPTIVNTESFRANMAREVYNSVKNLGAGTGISNADRDFAEQAAGGKVTLDDATMLRLMDVATAMNANVLMRHEKLLQQAGVSSGGEPVDLDMFRVPIDFNGGPNLNMVPGRGFETIKQPAKVGSPKPGTATPAAPAKTRIVNW